MRTRGLDGIVSKRAVSRYWRETSRSQEPGFREDISPAPGRVRGAERILADADTLMVFGLDHILSEQEAAPEEIPAIREWLSRDGPCPLLAPDHNVGFTGDMKQRRVNICLKRQGILPRVLVAASPKLIGDYPCKRMLTKGPEVSPPAHNSFRSASDSANDTSAAARPPRATVANSWTPTHGMENAGGPR
jgi:hypothetical protein